MHNPFPQHIIAGALCYALRDGQVLLLRRSRPPHLGYWSPPGGKMEHGESPWECCKREMQEETGLTVHDPVLRAIQTVIDLAYPVHWLLFVFRATQVEGRLAERDTEEGLLHWWPLDTLDTVERPYADLRLWPHVLGDDPAIRQCKFVYDTPERLLEETWYTENGQA